jgi:hypothetical protein
MMTPRPGGAPEERKVSQGMQAQSRLDLDFGIFTLYPLRLCLPTVALAKVGRLACGCYPQTD